MKKNNVPQQNISTYSGNKKAIYATDENGEYTIIASSGWEVEEEVTRQALVELERLAREAHQEVRRAKRSTLYFHMYNRRMDLQTLSQSTGLFQWRIKRHFNPRIFKKLTPKILSRYGEALGLSMEALCTIPPQQPLSND
jgi:hypothetical protein